MRSSSIKVALAGALALGTLACTQTSSASPTHLSPRLTGAHPCADAPGFTCSTLAVPLDHRHRQGRQLDLQVAVQDRPDATRDLLVLAGGPGQPGVIYAPQLSQVTAPLAQYRIVMIDQRGTGATALDCPRLQQEMGEADLTPTPEAVQACVTELGPDARFYSTADTVADLDDLRAALGDRTIALDGVSYGTYVAMRYAAVHPRRVSELVLDSVAPDGGPEPLSTTPMAATGRVLRAACAATADCPGDVVADLATVVRNRTDGANLVNIIGELGYVRPNYNGLAAILHQAANGNSGPLDTLVANFTQGNSPPIAEYSEGLHVATWCADVAWPWHTAHASPARRARTIDAAVRALPTSAFYPFDRRTVRTAGILQACLRWPYAPEHSAQGHLPRNVPVLLLGGDRDLLTPIEWLRAEARRMPQSTVVIVPGAGHSLQLHSAAGLAAARTFLAAH